MKRLGWSEWFEDLLWVSTFWLVWRRGWREAAFILLQDLHARAHSCARGLSWWLLMLYRQRGKLQAWTAKKNHRPCQCCFLASSLGILWAADETRVSEVKSAACSYRLTIMLEQVAIPCSGLQTEASTIMTAFTSYPSDLRIWVISMHCKESACNKEVWQISCTVCNYKLRVKKIN